MSSTLPPDFDVSRLRTIPDPTSGEQGSLPEPPAVPKGIATRSERIGRQRVALALGIGWMVGQVFAFGMRKDLHDVPLSYVVALVIAPMLAAGLALALAVSPGRSGLGVNPGILTALTLALPVTLFVTGLVLSPAHADGPEGTFAQGVRCFGLMLAWTALPMGAAAFVLRQWFVVGAGLRSALVGVAAGMAAAAVINLHCHVTGVWHVAIGHWFAVAVAALCGVWALGRRTRV